MRRFKRRWGLQADSGPCSPALPFAMEEAVIYGGTREAMWAWVRHGDDGKIAVVLCDEEGRASLAIEGLATRVMKSAGMEKAVDHLLLHPHWQEQPVDGTGPIVGDHRVILCDLAALSPDHLQRFLKGSRCLALQTIEGHHGERFQQYALQLFETLQQMMKAGPKKQVLVQVAVPLQEEEGMYEGLWAILQTAHLENPHIIGQLIAVEAGESAKEVAEKLKENAASSRPSHIRYQNGRRYTARWQALKSPLSPAAPPWKAGGVYLITGGLGGLGLLFAKEIARHAPNSTLILTGRSPMDKEKEEDLPGIDSQGGSGGLSSGGCHRRFSDETPRGRDPASARSTSWCDP